MSKSKNKTRLTKVVVVVLLLDSCSNNISRPGNGQIPIVPPGVLMSAKPETLGLVRSNNMLRTLGVVSGIDVTANGNINSAFNDDANNMSIAGGPPSPIMFQALLNTSGQVAIERINIDAAKPISAPTRWANVNYSLGRTSPTGANLFSPAVLDSIVASLIRNITGVEGTPAQTAALRAEADVLLPLMTNDAKGTKYFIVLLATTVLVGLSAYR